MESTITPQIATSSSKDIATSPFLQLNYWFGTPIAASLNHWVVALGAGISTLILIAFASVIAMKILRSGLTPPQQKFFTRLSLALLTLGTTGWTFVLARIFGVVFFSARFWWILWFSLLTVSAFWFYKNYKKLPILQAQYQTYQLKRRYFPKKKKR